MPLPTNSISILLGVRLIEEVQAAVLAYKDVVAVTDNMGLDRFNPIGAEHEKGG